MIFIFLLGSCLHDAPVFVVWRMLASLYFAELVQNQQRVFALVEKAQKVKRVFHPSPEMLQLKTEKHLCIIDILIWANAQVFVKWL